NIPIVINLSNILLNFCISVIIVIIMWNNFIFDTNVWRFFFMTTYHFIGIKGTGMSALAQILHDSWENVKGSDVDKRFFTQKALEEKNISILPFSEDNITDDCTIIAGTAISESNVEVKASKEIGLPFYWYHDFLREWLTEYTT